MTASVPETSNQGGEPKVPRSFANNAKEGWGTRRDFPRSRRLLRHADFERVYKQGRKHFSASMTVFYLARAESGGAQVSGLRVGFTVGRALGGAVLRNRIRRRLREAVRLSLPAAQVDADVVINPKKALLTAEFEAVLNEVRRAFVVIEKASIKYPVPSTEGGKEEARSRNRKA